MNLAARFFRMGLAVVLAGAALLRAEDLAARVIIVANSDDPDSVRLARYYAEKRAVPVENIFALKLPLAETITWPEFVTTLWQPLQDELIRTKWIDAIEMDLSDATGRRKIAPHGHRISYLVVCRGVPLRISHDPALYQDRPPATSHPEFRTNQAAVDAELALLARSAPPINGFMPNPLFHNDHPAFYDSDAVIKVSRLDGPTYEDARALVDHALVAEREGLTGRAYVDIGGIHPSGDEWLESVAKEIKSLGFPLDIDREPTTFPATARFDAPALYFGWYAGDLNGPFALPGFRFPAGAVALHIHSYSARTLRSATEGWCGPLVARGVTATVGNVFEPYLEYLHRPDLLLHALVTGATFGDAATYALPVLGWESIAIGDPLYRPFAVPLDEQLKNAARLTPRREGYAVLRRVQQLEAASKPDEALALLLRNVVDRPSLAPAVALAARLERAGDNAGAAQALAFASQLRKLPADEWALARLAARELQEAGSTGLAREVWENLLATPELPIELRTAWMEEAR